MSEVTQNQEVVAAPKLTRTEKLVKKAEMLKARIEKDSAEYNEVVGELESINRLANLAAGQSVKVRLGRKFADKDTTRIVDALVVAVREGDDGEKQYKVQHGTGFDAEITVVGGAAIVEITA